MPGEDQESELLKLARPPKPSQGVYLRRRLLAGGVVLLVFFVLIFGVIKVVGALFGGSNSGDQVSVSAGVNDKSTKGSKSSTPTTSTSTTTTTVEVAAPEPKPDRTQGEPASSGKSGLARIQTLGGSNMSPKSVVASPKGIVFAQNMMYHHTISVFSTEGALIKTIPDAVELSKFGIEGHPGTSKGAPVEAAFSPDGKTAWVSNYSMYGSGFGPEGKDKCSPGDGTSTSFLYRIDVATLAITHVIPVGAVPKYVAATPDGSKVLVSNWCTWDLSIIDTKTNTEIRKVSLNGRYPRGIAVNRDSTKAYVAMMGSDRIMSVDLTTYAASVFASPGAGPRHIVISPDSAHLYVSNNRGGNVVRVDTATGKVTASVSTGSQPRSMAISSDGEAVYVVNYESSTMTKVRTSDMSKMQTVQTDHHPIGITYEPTLKRVWVANYGGRVIVFDDSKVLTD